MPNKWDFENDPTANSMDYSGVLNNAMDFAGNAAAQSKDYTAEMNPMDFGGDPNDNTMDFAGRHSPGMPSLNFGGVISNEGAPDLELQQREASRAALEREAAQMDPELKSRLMREFIQRKQQERNWPTEFSWE